MTFSRKFSVSQHVNNLIPACSQRTLRQRGLPDNALHEVFYAVVINKLTHASPAWWGFASADDRNRLYSVSQKNPPLRFSEIFSQRLGIFNQFFTHLLHDHFYTTVQIFIQISPTLTKLCHTKRDHLAKFYVSLEL